MADSKTNFDCNNCIYGGTFLCECCVTVQHPSGRFSKPTKYVGVDELKPIKADNHNMVSSNDHRGDVDEKI